MKPKILLITMVGLFILVGLSACGGSAASPAEAEAGSESSAEEGSSSSTSSAADPQPGVREDFLNAMPISAQLGFGTLLLEDSGYAVDPAQAAELLPLWKAARSLSESDTVAEAELEAVFNQIEDTMTSEQITFITEEQLTGEEMGQLMEELGISIGFGGAGFGDLTPEQQATAQAARESGEGFPGGGFPGGGIPGEGFPGGGIPGGGNPGGRGQGGFGGGNLTPEQQATIEARRSEGGGIGARFALVFIDALIDLLEARATE